MCQGDLRKYDALFPIPPKPLLPPETHTACQLFSPCLTSYVSICATFLFPSGLLVEKQQKLLLVSLARKLYLLKEYMVAYTNNQESQKHKLRGNEAEKNAPKYVSNLSSKDAL